MRFVKKPKQSPASPYGGLYCLWLLKMPLEALMKRPGRLIGYWMERKTLNLLAMLPIMNPKPFKESSKSYYPVKNLKLVGGIKMSTFFMFAILMSLVNPTKATEIGIINDPFFTNPQTIISIRDLVPHLETVRAIVDGTNDTDTRTISIEPFVEKLWVHNDGGKYSQERWNCTILCGNKTASKSKTKEYQSLYTLMRTFEDKEREPTLEVPVTVYQYQEYRRIDGSIYIHQLQALYELQLKEERVVAPNVSQCTKEWTITSQWQRKLRHSRRHYSAMDIYHLTIKIPRGLTLTVASNDLNNIVARKLLRKELTFTTFEAETPECGTNGGNLPIGAIIV